MRVASPGTVTAFVTAAALAFGCGKAASVFLDLPERPEEETGTATGGRVPPSAEEAVPQGAGAMVAGEPRQAPAIERTLDPDSVVALLPKDAAGNVDWVAALSTGVIAPRTSLPGSPPAEVLTGFRFDFRYQGGFNAYFPHSAHVSWLSCDGCHLTIFPIRGDRPSMAAINDGEACGRCHGKVAFPASTCERCHSAMTLPEGRLKPELLGDIVFSRAAVSEEAGGFPAARFRHWVHRIRYRCMACHPGVFGLRAGETRITMADMENGASCGACHNGEASFALTECNRCHLPLSDEAQDTVP